MSENTGSSRRRKVISATLAIAMATTMLLSGTLAYFYQTRAVNIFKGEELTKEVIAHDDFDKTTGNKDIYLENTGTSPVYVRIRLTEDFWSSEETNTGAAVPDTTYKYRNGYMPNADHTAGSMVHAVSNDPTADPLAGNGEGDFHEEYFAWTWGNQKKQYLSAADNETTQAYSNDNTTEKYIEDRVAHDNSNTTYTMGAENIKETEVSEGVMSYMKWYNLTSTASTATPEEITAAWENQYNFTGWVMDRNGWCYWSQPLMPGQATGLLLDQVTKKGQIANDALNYEYHIHVDFEAVNMNDYELWMNRKPASSDGDTWNESGYIDWRLNGLLKNITDKIKYGEKITKLIEQLQKMKTDYPKTQITGHETDSEGHPVYYYSMGAMSDIETALQTLYQANYARAKQYKESAEAKQAAYIADKTAVLNGDTTVQDPDGTAIDLTTLQDDAARAYLSKYAHEAGKLTYDEVKGINSFDLAGSKDNPVQISDLSWITNETLPNLKTLTLIRPDETSLKGYLDLSNFPDTIETIIIQNDSAITGINVSGLPKLKRIDFERCAGLTKFTETKNADGTYTGIYGLDAVAEQMESISVRGCEFTTFDGTPFKNLKSLWIGAYVPNTWTSVNLSGLTKLSTFSVFPIYTTTLDISDIADELISVADMRKLEEITINSRQILTDLKRELTVTEKDTGKKYKLAVDGTKTEIS